MLPHLIVTILKNYSHVLSIRKRSEEITKQLSDIFSRNCFYHEVNYLNFLCNICDCMSVLMLRYICTPSQYYHHSIDLVHCCHIFSVVLSGMIVLSHSVTCFISTLVSLVLACYHCYRTLNFVRKRCTKHIYLDPLIVFTCWHFNPFHYLYHYHAELIENMVNIACWPTT